jgi:hypothetical protein
VAKKRGFHLKYTYWRHTLLEGELLITLFWVVPRFLKVVRRKSSPFVFEPPIGKYCNFSIKHKGSFFMHTHTSYSKFDRFCSFSLTLPLLLSLAVLTLGTSTALASGDKNGKEAGKHEKNRGRRTMTGLWVTRVPSPFVIQYGSGPTKEATEMAWTLVEDEDGLITGFNTYLSTSSVDTPVTAGALCMVGARVGSRIVISEAPVESPTTPIFVFDCERKNKTLRCLGHGLANLEPIALQARLSLRKESIEAVDRVTEEILAVCQPE